MSAANDADITPVDPLRASANRFRPPISSGQSEQYYGSILFRPTLILRCLQLVPQIIKNYRRHGTDGLSAAMMFSWCISAVPFGIYAISQYLNIPLQLQPQLFLLLALITWAQIMYYDRHWSLKKCLSVVMAICVLFGGIEAGVIFGIRVPWRRCVG